MQTKLTLRLDEALIEGADAIATHNVKDFSKSLIPVFNPMELHVITFPKNTTVEN